MKKFITFIPYVVIVVLLAAIIEHGHLLRTDIIGFFNRIIDLPFELMLLSGCLWLQDNVTTLWYLGALILVLPVFATMSQMKNKNVLFLISGYMPLLYYEFISKTETTVDFYLIRAISYMLLGAFVYRVSEYLKNIEGLKKVIIILTIVEQSCLWFTILALYKNWNMEKNILLSFVIGLILFFSHKTYTYKIKGKFLPYLGKISMVMYIFHWEIGTVIYKLGKHLEVIDRILLYYIVAILLSAIYYLGVENLKGKIRTIREK